MAVFLLVLLLHVLLVQVLIRELKRIRFTKRESSDALLIYFLPREASPASDVPKADSPAKAPRRNSELKRNTPPENASNALVAPPAETVPPPPQIDWQHELELSAHVKKEKIYRDLAKSMSPSQLDWVRQHHMEPASLGLTWKRPRVEVTKDGMPIVHISDHCVLVPLLFVPMVFCSIGHIEPNGDLFNHMHDPKPP
jgi:hypothetical protein